MRFVNGALPVSIAMLTGCSSLPATRTVDVKVPVPVTCLTALPARPAFMTDAQLKAGSDYQVVNNLLADRLARQYYISQLEAALTGCLKT